MEKNISANLNFADSLSDFEKNVTNLLDLKNIEEWSGRIRSNRSESSSTITSRNIPKLNRLIKAATN
jgi:16S rRNA G527 N7-methylase RsmG